MSQECEVWAYKAEESPSKWDMLDTLTPSPWAIGCFELCSERRQALKSLPSSQVFLTTQQSPTAKTGALWKDSVFTEHPTKNPSFSSVLHSVGGKTSWKKYVLCKSPWSYNLTYHLRTPTRSPTGTVQSLQILLHQPVLKAQPWKKAALKN